MPAASSGAVTSLAVKPGVVDDAESFDGPDDRDPVLGDLLVGILGIDPARSWLPLPPARRGPR